MIKDGKDNNLNLEHVQIEKTETSISSCSSSKIEHKSREIMK